MNRFEGRTVMVTGAGSGIGHAAAEAFAMEGARLILLDLRREPMDALRNHFGEDRVTVLAGDITSAELVAAAVAAADGRIDALANVAGIMDGFLPVAELTDALWDKVLQVNLTAPMRLMRAVLPAMLARGRGSIVNVSSTAGYKGGAAGAAYTASKHGLIGLTRSAAVIYGPQGIRVNAIAPGGVATNIEQDWRSELAEQRLGPLLGATVGSIVQPAVLAKPILWLASEEAANINGVVLAADGGWSAI